MSPRLRQIVLLVGACWFSWLAMMLVHECGHVLGALSTGGQVQRVVWYPTVLSRTDVSPNPHPLIEVAAGPLIGCLLPLLLAGCAAVVRLRISYLVTFFAGFCLIANGGYIGVGAVSPIGDARQLIDAGAPRFALAAFGVVTFTAGLWLWHRISPRLGFGRSPTPIPNRDLYTVLIAAAALTILALLFGHPG